MKEIYQQKYKASLPKKSSQKSIKKSRNKYLRNKMISKWQNQRIRYNPHFSLEMMKKLEWSKTISNKWTKKGSLTAQIKGIVEKIKRIKKFRKVKRLK